MDNQQVLIAAYDFHSYRANFLARFLRRDVPSVHRHDLRHKEGWEAPSVEGLMKRKLQSPEAIEIYNETCLRVYLDNRGHF